MKDLSADEIRERFLRYFEKHGHRRQSSYPLVPPNDPTLLFTNAGMVQFKDVFTGEEKRDFTRATSSQKCVRAGGKHNDLENVGFTARHHTFFEMLGNFSFGDYFKKDAIRFGWEFLVDEMGLPPDKLWVTVFGGDAGEGLPPDGEAAELWEREIGVRPERIRRFGKKDNFWSMGDTGPCGPCSEIIYDQGEAVACSEPGGCRGLGCECDRYLEVWNLVFMQFDRDAGGTLTPLPAPSIDTGMGLERLAAVVQGVHSNYDTDLFGPLIARNAEIAGCAYGADPDRDAGLRVVADHARATAFLIADGVLPSNEGRGYVLRRIMRRAIRHGAKLDIDEPFFHLACQAVIERMRAAYPELDDKRSLIDKAVRTEEETFRRTLDNGLRLLRREIDARRESEDRVLPGKLVFDLQTRDGFPPDLTALIAREQGFAIDEPAYQREWERHQAVSGGGLGLEGIDEIYKQVLADCEPTVFSGYDRTAGLGRVQALIASEQADGKTARRRTERAKAGEIVEAVISPTPFYGETGGQVGDTGALRGASGLEARVLDAKRILPELIVHRVEVQRGELRTGDEVSLEVAPERRQRIRLNHSATHLLQAALRELLGSHVNQKGSLVEPGRLRFDFSHFEALRADEIAAVERRVNELIRQNLPVEVSETDMEGARRAGATMLFGEKYADRVRMVRMGDQSLELCGGTHTERTGDIGLFQIVSESAVQAGVRRIEALTGPGALDAFQDQRALFGRAAAALRTSPAQLAERAQALVERERQLGREVEQLKQQLATGGGGRDPASEARSIAGVEVLATRVEGIRMGGLREFADQLRDKLGGGVVMVAAVDKDKLSAVCTVGKELTDRLKAGALLKGVFDVTGGRGGGRPDFAQGGGGDPAKLPEAIEAFYSLVEKALT
ncbi:MAG: alanine--tRNA ligase [Deltaproteobacteria bacterium]|nr:alanine--tRNA ligase [Deltaproteobacteria bacterium]